jgi:methionine-gamma-lyase
MPSGKEREYSIASMLIHGKFMTENWDYRHHIIPPVSCSAAYRLDSIERGAKGFAQLGHEPDEDGPIYIYDRLGEPSRNQLEDQMAMAEGGEFGITFASGMGAISASILAFLRCGDEVVVHKVIYGCTDSLLRNWAPRWGVKVNWVDMRDLDQLRAAITEKTRVVYCETPANPTLELIDLKEVSAVVAEVNRGRDEETRARLVVDNTFATPFCQRPLSLGADIVVNSLTKNICGFGTDMGGCLVARDKSLRPHLTLFMKDIGSPLSPKVAWPIMVYGLPSLPLRLEKQMKNARKIATFLEEHPAVERVFYPGLDSFPQKELARRQMIDYEGNFAPGNMIYFILAGDPAQSQQRGIDVMNYLAREAYTLTLAVSLGQIRTLVECPAAMTHSMVPAEVLLKEGVHPGGVRLSIGVEHVEDIIKDLSEAFAAVVK